MKRPNQVNIEWPRTSTQHSVGIAVVIVLRRWCGVGIMLLTIQLMYAAMGDFVSISKQGRVRTSQI